MSAERSATGMGGASTEVYLSRFGQALGEPGDIGDIPEVRTSGALERLRKEGLRCYRHSELAPWELALGSARQTLGVERIGPDDPRPASVVYTTDSFWTDADQEIAAARCLDGLGLGRTPLLGLGLAGCANLTLAVRTATAYLRSGLLGSALLVTTDACAPGERLMGASSSVLSDGAASCLVGRQRPESGFRVLGVEVSIEAGMHPLRVLTDTIAMVKGTVDGIRRAAEALYERTGIDPGDVDLLVTNNYSLSVLRIFAAVTRVPFERTYVENVAEVGHCYAADGLVNLASARAGGQLAPGGLALVVMTGHNSWGCLAVEVV